MFNKGYPNTQTGRVPVTKHQPEADKKKEKEVKDQMKAEEKKLKEEKKLEEKKEKEQKKEQEKQLKKEEKEKAESPKPEEDEFITKLMDLLRDTLPSLQTNTIKSLFLPIQELFTLDLKTEGIQEALSELRFYICCEDKEDKSVLERRMNAIKNQKVANTIKEIQNMMILLKDAESDVYTYNFCCNKILVLVYELILELLAKEKGKDIKMQRERNTKSL